MANFWKINEDGKSELHFDFESFKALGEADKKEIKAYYLWSRGKSAWISKVANNTSRTESIAKRTNLSFMGASKKESKFSYRTQGWIKQMFDGIGKEELEDMGEPKNWDIKDIQDFYIDQEGVDSLGRDETPDKYDDFYNEYWQTVRKDLQTAYDSYIINTNNVPERDKKEILYSLNNILKIVKGETFYSKTLIVDAFMRKLVKMPLVSRAFAIQTAIDLQEKNKITIFNSIHKFWKIVSESEKPKDSQVVNSTDKKISVIVEPKGNSAYDIQGRRYIKEYLSDKRILKEKEKARLKHLAIRNNYVFYGVFDNSNKIHLFLSPSLRPVYEFILGLDIEDINIVREKKDGDNLYLDYYNGSIFGNYVGEFYNEDGSLKKEVKQNAIDLILNHFENKYRPEQLIGGVSDGKSIIDIAKKHAKDEGWMREQLETGINVEFEHTNDRGKATEIALDHLFESPIYYIELAKLENKLEHNSIISEIQDIPKLNSANTNNDDGFSAKIKEMYYKKQVKSTKEQVLDVLKRADLDWGHIKILQNWEGEGSVKDGDSKTGILHEFFTPYWLCQSIGEIVKSLGIDNPKVLDPAIGTSRLINNIKYKQYVGFEVNPFNFEISKKLHYGSNVNLYNQAFETAFLKAPRFNSLAKDSWIGKDYDLVVSNPPYGEYRGEYKTYMPKVFTRFEFLFVYLTMTLVKKGGYGIFVLPQSFMNNGNMYNTQKEKIMSICEFVDAVRLPNGIFATTEIGVDLLILRKK